MNIGDTMLINFYIVQMFLLAYVLEITSIWYYDFHFKTLLCSYDFASAIFLGRDAWKMNKLKKLGNLCWNRSITIIHEVLSSGDTCFLWLISVSIVFTSFLPLFVCACYSLIASTQKCFFPLPRNQLSPALIK